MFLTGVASVKFVLPRQPRPRVPGSPVYPHSATVTVSVRSNIAAAQVDRGFSGRTPPMIWYGANGQVVRRIGNLIEVNHVVAPAVRQRR